MVVITGMKLEHLQKNAHGLGKIYENFVEGKLYSVTLYSVTFVCRCATTPKHSRKT